MNARLQFLRKADALAKKYSNDEKTFKIEQGNPFSIECGYLVITVCRNNKFYETISTNIYNSDRFDDNYYKKALKTIDMLIKKAI